MSSILITGGAGFIGSHLTERLLRDGKRVVVLDSFDPFYDPDMKRKNLLAASGALEAAGRPGDARQVRDLARRLGLALPRVRDAHEVG